MRTLWTNSKFQAGASGPDRENVICDFRHVSTATYSQSPRSSAIMASDGQTSPVKPPTPVTQSKPRVHRHNVNGLSDTARDKYQRFARNIERKVVGPMPVDLFLEIFLPCRTRIPRFAGVMFSGVPDGPDKESAIYPSSVSRMTSSVVLSLIPHLEGCFKRGPCKVESSTSLLWHLKPDGITW